MNLSQPTLIEFEDARKMAGIIPPAGSNSFYNIGDGRYYLNATCSRGMLDVYAFNRFAETIIAIFEVLTRVEKDT